MTIARVGARTRARASIAAHIDSKEFVPAFFPSFSCLASRARDARGAARGGIRRRETPLQRAPSRASARRARRGAALERRAVRCSTFFLLSRRFRDDRAESRARRRVPRCPRARPRPRHKVETPRRNVTWRHDREDAREKAFRGSLATRSRPTRGLFQRSPPSPSDSTSLSSWPKSDVDAT